MPDGPGKGSAQALGTWLGERRLPVLLALTIAVFAAFAPGFFSYATWIAVTSYFPEILLLALGETIVIITAGIDLSVGAVLDFAGMSAAIVMRSMIHAHLGLALTIGAGLLAALMSGLAWGAINGLIITRTQVSPFIVTLGTLGMATGGAYLFTADGASVSTVPAALGTFANANLLGFLPMVFVIGALCTVAVWLLMTKTRFGLRTVAIGSNLRAAAVAGVNTRRHLFYIYVLSGLLAGIDGFLVTARFVSATPLAGADDLLSAIAAVVIGGASLFGGKGSIGGSFIGSAIIGVLLSGLILIGLQSYWQTVATGVVVVLVVGIDQYRQQARLDVG